jgi:hypothetical protein
LAHPLFTVPTLLPVLLQMIGTLDEESKVIHNINHKS